MTHTGLGLAWTCNLNRQEPPVRLQLRDYQTASSLPTKSRSLFGEIPATWMELDPAFLQNAVA